MIWWIELWLCTLSVGIAVRILIWPRRNSLLQYLHVLLGYKLSGILEANNGHPGSSLGLHGVPWRGGLWVLHLFTLQYSHTMRWIVPGCVIACLTRKPFKKTLQMSPCDTISPPHIPTGASSAWVCSYGHNDGAKPGHRGEGALLPEEDAAVSHADWLHAHHHHGQLHWMWIQSSKTGFMVANWKSDGRTRMWWASIFKSGPIQVLILPGTRVNALGGGNPDGFDFYTAKYAADSRCGTPVFAVCPHRDLIKEC